MRNEQDVTKTYAASDMKKDEIKRLAEEIWRNDSDPCQLFKAIYLLPVCY